MNPQQYRNMTKQIAVVGPNAAGKTAYLEVMSGVNQEHKNWNGYVHTPLIKLAHAHNDEKTGCNIRYTEFPDKDDLYNRYEQLLSRVDCILVMYDCGQEEAFKRALSIGELLSFKVPKVPKVLCGNKMELNEHYTPLKDEELGPFDSHIFMSVKKHENLYVPIAPYIQE